ncbi:hypothetical protein AKJ57_04655 [candidate division MSBL1 archaeon SCGC-AAA259A05]|uniref:Uncharacterized protein n=1 Tax=candidate division MSBL1 archaeon SCGC-AAA259A05 TaxID=1698259 RepID=A0A133U6X4_9EURY|nr:hypothetical protein AKJ57_04655 [candidate division MSBL1 archaeon SCGC-AAA259A05]
MEGNGNFSEGSWKNLLCRILKNLIRGYMALPGKTWDGLRSVRGGSFSILPVFQAFNLLPPVLSGKMSWLIVGEDFQE